MMWTIEANGDQKRWQDFCESFMSDDIRVVRIWRENEIVVICEIRLDPWKPIDSTGSMPSFVDQAKGAGFGIIVCASCRQDPVEVAGGAI